MTSSLEVPAATIGHTIASSWTMKSTTTGRSLIEFAFSITLSRSSGDSQRMATQPMASESLTKSGTRVPGLPASPLCSTVLE